jgi:hypothetical protein
MLSTILKKHNGMTALGSDHKLSVPSDAFSRAAVHSETRHVSPTRSRQVPEHKRILTHNSAVKIKKREAARNLTLQHLTDKLNDTNKKGVAFFKMHDSGHQTRHFILRSGYLFHKAARFAGLVQSNLCQTLDQR